MTAVPMASMSTADLEALILCADRKPVITAEVLDLTLNVIGDLSGRLDTTSSTVQWDASATVHRGCTLTLALADGDFDWGLNLLRLTYTLTDGVSGLSGWAYVGTFMLKRPAKTLGTVITDPSSPNVGLTAYQVNGQDVSASLDRQIGYSYTADQNDGDGTPVPVLQRLTELLAAAGFAGTSVLVDSAGAATLMTQDMPWPLLTTSIASSDDTTSTSVVAQPPDAPDADSGPTTWRTAANNLLAQITYRAVWADPGGPLRAAPYTDAASAASSFTFDIAATITKPDGTKLPVVTPLAPARTTTTDVGAFNKWTFIWQNIPDGAPDDSAPPDSGVIRVQNDTDGPSSIAACGGDPRGVSPTQVQITAATAADFQAQADAQVAAAKQSATTYSVQTVPYPLAGHYDVLTYIDPAAVDSGTAKVQATNWTLPLNGADMTWSWIGIS